MPIPIPWRSLLQVSVLGHSFPFLSTPLAPFLLKSPLLTALEGRVLSIYLLPCCLHYPHLLLRWCYSTYFQCPLYVLLIPKFMAPEPNVLWTPDPCVYLPIHVQLPGHLSKRIAVRQNFWPPLPTTLHFFLFHPFPSQSVAQYPCSYSDQKPSHNHRFHFFLHSFPTPRPLASLITKYI